MASDLNDRAAELGAVVGAPTAEWPMAVARRGGLEAKKAPGQVPKRRPKGTSVHEPEVKNPIRQ